MLHAHKNRHALKHCAQNTAAQNTVAQNTAAQNTALKTVCSITLCIDRSSRGALSFGLYTRLDKTMLVSIESSNIKTPGLRYVEVILEQILAKTLADNFRTGYVVTHFKQHLVYWGTEKKQNLVDVETYYGHNSVYVVIKINQYFDTQKPHFS